MEVNIFTTPSKPKLAEHPSVAQRRKLEEQRKQRLAEALRENLRKRKEQMRARLKVKEKE
ncbi:MAG: hypothetical protein K2W92_06850 [Alphaproteobacteria bacterium]|nr:hypothetical protein [Alphaproteobacteria bacterium]